MRLDFAKKIKKFETLHSNLYNALIFLRREVEKKKIKNKEKLPKRRQTIFRLGSSLRGG